MITVSVNKFLGCIPVNFTKFGFSLQIKLIGKEALIDRLSSSSRVNGINCLSHHTCRLHFPSKKRLGLMRLLTISVMLFFLDTNEMLWDAICLGILWVKLGLIHSLLLCPVGTVDPVEKVAIELLHVNETVITFDLLRSC